MTKSIPEKNDLIDIHSHHWDAEPGIFRIRSLSIPDFREIPTDRPCSIGLHPWHVYQEVAEIKMISEEELKEYIFGNFIKTFNR